MGSRTGNHAQVILLQSSGFHFSLYCLPTSLSISYLIHVFIFILRIQWNTTVCKALAKLGYIESIVTHMQSLILFKPHKNIMRRYNYFHSIR